MEKKQLLKVCVYTFYIGVFLGAFIYLYAIKD